LVSKNNSGLGFKKKIEPEIKDPKLLPKRIPLK